MASTIDEKSYIALGNDDHHYAEHGGTIDGNV